MPFAMTVFNTKGEVRSDDMKVVDRLPGDENGEKVMVGYGNPDCFDQMQDNGTPVRGHASHMPDELANDVILLTDNA